MPTVVFATESFAELTRQVVRHTAPPGARMVVVPHPLGGTAPEVVQGWGAAAADETLAALTS